MSTAMPAAPAAANLLKVLAEDPSTFEKEIGCMTGILQIFDRHRSFTGRRYGSKRVVTGDLSSAACKSPPHDPSRLSASYMFQSQEREQGASPANVNSRKELLDHTNSMQSGSLHDRVYLASPTPALPQDSSFQSSDETTAPRLSFYIKDQPSQALENTTNQKIAPRQPFSGQKGTPRASAAPRRSFSTQRETPRDSGAQARSSLDGRALNKNAILDSSLDIRDIVRESFHKEKPRMSVDTAINEVISGLTHLKNLPRSSSVGRRNGHSGMRMEFPRSNSTNAQSSTRLYIDANGANCIPDTARLQSRESNVRNLTNPRRSYDGNEVPRLTVELEEGPRLGSLKDDRRKSIDGKESRRLRGLNDPRKYERHATTNAGFDFRESLRAVDFKDSLRGSRKGKEAHRFSVDGTRDLPRASVAPRLSVDGRDTPQREKPSLRDECDSRPRGSNVVARLMGLEEYLSPQAEADCKEAQSKDANKIISLSREAKLLQGLLHTPARSPQCGERYGHSSPLQKNGQGTEDNLEKLEGHSKEQRRVRSLSPNHYLMDDMPPLFRQQDSRKSRSTKSKKQFCEDDPLQASRGSSPCHEPLHGDMSQRLQQLRSRNSSHERKILNQILEAIQLKGLLHPPHRKKEIQVTPPVLDTNPYVVERKLQHFTNEPSPHASPNVLTRGLQSMELENQITPKFGVPDSASVQNTAKQSSLEQNKTPKDEREASIVVLKPTHAKLNGIQPTKDPDCSSSRSGSSERSSPTALTQTNSDNGGTTKSFSSKPSNLLKPSKAQTNGTYEIQPTRQSSNVVAAVTNAKPHSSPGRAQQSSKPTLPVKAAFGSTSTRMPHMKSSHQGRALLLKDKEESKTALVTLRNQSSMKKKQNRIANPESKLNAKDIEGLRAQNAVFPIAVAKSKRPEKLIVTHTKIFEEETPGNGESRNLDPSTTSVSVSSPRISTSGRESPIFNSCAVEIHILGCCEGGILAVDGALKHLDDTQVRKQDYQVRVNAGAVDQSRNSSRLDSFNSGQAFDSTSANTRAKLQALKDQFLPLKEEELQESSQGNKELGEVKTPRGVLVKKTPVHESGQGLEGSEQPSPVSVLDNSVFEEDSTPSPRASKTSAINFPDSFEISESTDQLSEWRSQKLYQTPKSSSKPIETDHLSAGSLYKEGPKEYKGLCKSCVAIELPYDKDLICNYRGASLGDRVEEKEFVRDLLVVSGLTKENWVSENCIPARGHIINPILLARYERRRRRADRKALANVGDVFLKGWYKSEQEKEKEMLARRALFDSINELLVQKLLLQAGAQPWIQTIPLRVVQESEGQKLVQEIWEELQGMPCATSDDVCDTVQEVLQKDLGSRGPRWAEFNVEVGELGLELERMIYKDLLEEVVKELTPVSSCRKSLKPMEGSCRPRRQLFAI